MAIMSQRARWASIAAVLVVAAGCAPTSGGGGAGGPTVWRIPAGTHESTGSSLSFTGSDVVEFRARFDSSAEYSTVDPANQLDINKLRGVSDCSSHHQVDSARFGWRWNVDRIEILAYTYARGVRSSQLLGSVRPGDWHDYRLDVTAAGYVFALDGATTTMDRGCATPALAKYQLWPYFGGDEVAPHTITIEIDESGT